MTCPVVLARGFKPAACFDIWLAAFPITEMLYDTPFPIEPQNKLALKDRTECEIPMRYEQGETVGESSETFEISKQRVSQIIHGRQSRLCPRF